MDLCLCWCYVGVRADTPHMYQRGILKRHLCHHDSDKNNKLSEDLSQIFRCVYFMPLLYVHFVLEEYKSEFSEIDRCIFIKIS